MQTDRNEVIDFLRFLGLSLIILAHLYPPPWLFQLRNFDVPLMVLVSGLTHSLQPKKLNPIDFVAKRVKRLVYPAWTFLTLYFLCLTMFELKFDKLTFANVFHSYTFISGIGFVWIFRVFIITSALAPLVDRFNKKLRSNNTYLIILLCCFLSYEFLLLIEWKVILGAKHYLYFSSIVFYGIFYTLIFSLGTRLLSFNLNQICYVLISAILLFIGYAFYFLHITGSIPATQHFKYPPQLYYLSYSLMLCIICYLISPTAHKVIASWPTLNLLIRFISRNSLWIYFYHIIFIKINIKEQIPNLLLSYAFIYTASVICCFLQLSMVSKSLLLFSGNRTKQYIRLMFTG
ncbi:acyltransferase [Mucilaginibacter pallidiroseus]|uniref:Acyltransferase n=1 Tax=Mucilaginibacter pallidiroseus TaxID=2599295 RepID=A0A563UBY4_9SPHI|nr:acyltransferase [Mucilaginibacter pallidiroseus]